MKQVVINAGELGRKIRPILREKGISQTELSKGTMINMTSISRWFSGDHLPTLPNLVLLADSVGVSVDTLLDGWITVTEVD